MSGVIDVSVEKLDRINEYVVEFQRKILCECDDLSVAVANLEKSNSYEDIQDVRKMMKDVREIVESEEPTFLELKKSITTYSNKVKKMKKILGQK